MSINELTCLFCLEQSTEGNEVIQFSLHKIHEMPCTCRFDIHVECWMIYFLKKGGYECPICHAKIGVPLNATRPVQNITLQANNNLYSVSVPVDTSNTIHIQIPSRNRQLNCLDIKRSFIWGICFLLFVGLLTLAYTQIR